MIETLKRLGATNSCGVPLDALDKELGEGSREKLWEAVHKGEIRYSRQINGIGFWINEDYEENIPNTQSEQETVVEK